MTFDISRFGFGITGHVPLNVVRELAPIVEQAGFNTLWFNHTKKGNAYAAIEVAASVTSTLHLATGVTSIDAFRNTRGVIEEVRARDLPHDRLTIGIGANQPPSPLRTVREATDLLREELPGVPVIWGALGPKMRALGVQHADGILLNWLTPAAAALAMEDRRRDAPESEAEVALYVRCAFGSANHEAIRVEADRYASFPSYAANFKRLGYTAMDAAVCVDDAAELRDRLAQYQDVVDAPVLRAITAEDTVAAYSSLVEAAIN